MTKLTKITHQRLTEVLDYAPETGVFVWKVRPSNRVKLGDRAGVVTGNGHRYIMIDGEKFQASRLAWFYVKGVWPSGDIKQPNGDHDDCSIENLKDVSRVEAARERGLNSDNTSGFAGVSRAKHDKWQAKITWNYEQINLGASFETAEDASEAYQEAAQRLQNGFARGEGRDTIIGAFKHWRRQRTVWSHLIRTHDRHDWKSFEDFCQTVKEFPESRYAMVAVDMSQPIGPYNYQWTQSISAERGKVGAEYNKATRVAKRDHIRNKDFTKKYGIDYAQYQAMLLEQKGVCASCEKPETRLQNGSIRMLSVDHNHTTGAVRGLLCSGCNLAIGYACDDPEVLMKAAAYLKKYQPQVIPFRDPKRDWLIVATPNFEGSNG